MKLASILLITFAIAFQACSGQLYAMSGSRYEELHAQINQLQFSDQKYNLLSNTAATFGFNCTQVRELLSYFVSDGDKLVALEAFKNSIIDPVNKERQIIEFFERPEDRQKASEVLANTVACRIIPDYKDPYSLIHNATAAVKWNQTELKDLIRVITRVPTSYAKLRIAEVAVKSHPEMLDSEQAMLLFSAYSSYRDILTLRTLINEKIFGVTSQQLMTLLRRFSFENMRSEILETLQCVNENATCSFNYDLLSLTEFIRASLMGATCDQLSSVGEKFAFEDQKLEILVNFSSNIIDTDNKFSMLNAFTFASSKEKALKIINNIKPYSPLFGIPGAGSYFILDSSSSMGTSFIFNGTGTTRIDFMYKELKKVLSSFNESVTFGINIFWERNSPWKPELMNATQDNIKSASDFASVGAGSTTNGQEALRLGFSVPKVETIYFVSDRVPSSGKTDLTAILADVKNWHSQTRIKINAIALMTGSTSENRTPFKNFMKALADITGGTYKSFE